MYYFMFVLGFIFLLWYNYNFYHIYNISRKRALLYSLTFIYGMVGANIMGRIFTAICSAININDSSRLAIFGAVLFAPLFILLTVAIEKMIFRTVELKKQTPEKSSKKSSKKTPARSKSENVSYRDTLDLLTPGLFVTIAFGKIGCAIEGCCFGIECGWGIHSDEIDATVFPVQLFESVTLLLIMVCCYYLKRTRFYRRGMAYPLTAVLYCSSRFGFEFLRYYEPQLRYLLFGMTLWQCLCIVVIIASIVSLCVIYRKEESSPLLSLSFMPKKTGQKDKEKDTAGNSL